MNYVMNQGDRAEDGRTDRRMEKVEREIVLQKTAVNHSTRTIRVIIRTLVALRPLASPGPSCP